LFPTNVHDIEKLDNRTYFSTQMIDEIKNSKYIIITIPYIITKYLANIEWFDKIREDQCLFLITSQKGIDTVKSESKMHFIKRPGIARIGLENQAKITEQLLRYKKQIR